MTMTPTVRPTMLLAFLLAVPTMALAGKPTVSAAELTGLGSWQGVRSIRLSRDASIAPAAPMRLELSSKGHVTAKIAGDPEGDISLQQYKGHVRGVVRSKKHGTWLIRQAPGGTPVVTALDPATLVGCETASLPVVGVDGDGGGSGSPPPPPLAGAGPDGDHPGVGQSPTHRGAGQRHVLAHPADVPDHPGALGARHVGGRADADRGAITHREVGRLAGLGSQPVQVGLDGGQQPVQRTVAVQRRSDAQDPRAGRERPGVITGQVAAGLECPQVSQRGGRGEPDLVGHRGQVAPPGSQDGLEGVQDPTHRTGDGLAGGGFHQSGWRIRVDCHGVSLSPIS